MPRSRKLGYVAVGILGLGLAITLFFVERYVSDSRQEWRVGYHDLRPFLYPNPDGTGPAGFAKDVLERAAANAGIRLRWVHVPEGAAAAFRDGKIDIWPKSTVVAGMARAPYVTSPWFYDAYGLVVRAGAAELAPNPILVTGPSLFATSLGRQLFPNATVESRPALADAVRAVCDGQIDAAFAEMRQAVTVLMNSSPCAANSLRIQPVAGASFSPGIGATWRAAMVAERLRWQIDTLAESGALVQIHSTWYLATPNELRPFEDSARLRRGNLLLAVLAIALALALAALARLSAGWRTAREAADRGNRAKSTFLATMSHELRTPMNGVLGMTEMLRATPLDPAQREMVETIYGSSEALLAILNDVLDYSKVEAGGITLRPQPCGLNRLLEDCRSTLVPLASTKELALSVELAPGTPLRIVADSGRLRQVLLNLMGNALKFTHTGSVAVRAMASGGRLRFEVADTGPGIAAEDRKHLFQPFTQLDSGATRAHGGTGLGLAISRHLVRAMGGEIELESEVGKGSKFFFDIPLVEAPAAATGPASAAPSRRGLRILAAEDNAVNQMVLTRMLERLGHSVSVCPDGAKAVESFSSGEWDAVLLDCHMPSMNGFEASRRIREAEAAAGRHTPIIAMTASVLEADRKLCMEAGMDDFVSKPIVLDTLGATLARHCQ